jgi:hypothetical protein
MIRVDRSHSSDEEKGIWDPCRSDRKWSTGLVGPQGEEISRRIEG